MIFESHAHYDDKTFNSDREELLSSLEKNGIGYVINVGASINGNKKGVELAKKYPFMYCSVGVHPHYANDINDDIIEMLENFAKNEKKVVAVGEIGLDYYRDLSPRDIQCNNFIAQINMAKRQNLPLIIHSREATDETYQILLEQNVKNIGGVIHCFSSNVEYAEKYIKMGFLIGVGGVVTYSNSKKLVEVVKKIPLESILVETDCPYLSPEPFRGKRNDSSNLVYVIEKISEIKNVPYDEVVNVTNENGKRLFSRIS